MAFEQLVAGAVKGSTKVYNWDFAGNKWVNFSPTHKYSFIKIVLRDGEFRVIIQPDGASDAFDFRLPPDVQVTKTGDMIQFAVPDPQDATGGKLVAIKFDDKEQENNFTFRAGNRIEGFQAIKPAQSEPASSSHRSNDLNKPPARQPQAAQPHIDNTFSTDRYDGSNYQAPTLPSSVTGGGGANPQPRRSAYTTAIPSSSRQAEEPKSRRSGELGYRGNYQQQPPPVINDLNKPDPVPPPAAAPHYNPVPQSQYGRQDWKPVVRDQDGYHDDRRGPNQAYNEGGGGGQRYSGERRGRDSGERRDRYSGERRDGYSDERRDGYSGERRDGYSGERRGRDSGERRDMDSGERRRNGGYQNERMDQRYDDRGYDRYQGDRGYPDDQGRHRGSRDDYHDDRDNYQDGYRQRDGSGSQRGSGGYHDFGDRYEGDKGYYNQDEWRSDGYRNNKQDERRYPHNQGYRDFPKNYHDDDWHDGGRRNNEDGGGNWRQRNEYHNYDGRGRAHQRANEYTDDNNDGYGRERYEEQGRGGGGGGGRGYGNRGRKGPQQKQQRIEPLIKPIPQESMANSEDIKALSQRLAESLSCCNTSDSHELIELLVTLVSQSGASDMPSLPMESLGSFSVTFQPGETVKPVEIGLELVVEPLNGKSFTVYPQVTTNDTIEKLKLDVQKNYKIPKECQYWVVGSQLAEDKQTVADLEMIKDTTVYVYVQHPHKAKVHKNAMREVESQSKKPTTSPPQHRAPPSQQNASPPRRNVPPPGGYPLEQPGQSLRACQDPPNEEQAVFRGAVPMPGKAPPVGGIRVMPAPQRSDHAHKVREIQPLPVAVEEMQQRKSPSPPPPPPSPPGWDCPSCTFKNLPYRPGCEVCNGPRPDDFLPPPNYMPTEAEKKFMNNNDQELRNFLELERKKQEEEAQRNYAALLNTDAVPVVLNEEEFDCPVCYVPIDPGDGIRLRGCLHMVCKDCLKGTTINSENVQINCPFVDDDGVECNETISEREIREVLDEKELESYFGRGLRAAEATDPNSFHCKTADCPGFCFYEDEVNEFRCQNCGHTNCILCKAQHEDMNCQQYQDDLKLKAANDEAARETQKMLEDMVAQGEAMNCPQCKIIVTKKVGCDWIRCVMCKTEMCWATKGPRWGPKGRGDITGGCKCGVNGARCHPNCRNCH